MNKSNAPRFMAAAENDGVLAAWASIIHEFKLPCGADVSPYEHLEAFQDLFRFELVAQDDYDRTDIKQVFFSGRRPTADDVQRVLDQIDYGEFDPKPLESTVSRKLQVTGRQDLASPGGQLAATDPILSLNVFDSGGPALQSRGGPNIAVFDHPIQEPPVILAPVPRSYLETSRSHREMSRSDPNMLRFEATCFGHSRSPHPGEEVTWDVGNAEHSEISAEETNGEMSMDEYVFQGTCPVCGRHFCVSAGTPLPVGAY